MNYIEAMEYIHSPRYSGMRLGLENMKLIMNALGNPEKKLKVIHIAGTNGKGSVASYLSHILTEAGYKTGLFTSPFIEKFNERIKINQTEITNEALSRITNLIKEKVEESNTNPTEFEIITAIALQYFFEEACDIVILEVGLGGRLDSTNIIETPLLSIITPISYDHQAYLGETLGEIATEKAGIIKERVPVLIYPQQEETEEVINRVAKRRNATRFKPDFNLITSIQAGVKEQKFSYKHYEGIKISLLGEHQLRNASLAIEAIDYLRNIGYSINNEVMYRGLASTTWPGRFEIIQNDPTIIIDGAHNIDSIRSLVDNLQRYFNEEKIIAIFGVLKDKDIRMMIEEISPIIERFITVTPDSPRALHAEELAHYLKQQGLEAESASDYTDALQRATEYVKGDSIICAFGSLYYIGEIRKIITKK